MIENKENYVFNEEENTVVKNFAVLKDGKQIAGGFVGISDEELLALYETNPELAEQDGRLAGLLEGGQETTVDPEPTQLDRIESALSILTADTVTEESINTAISEGVNEV